MNVAVIAPIVVVAVIVGRIVALMRGRRIREKYVWAWLALALAIAVVGLVPGLAAYLTEKLGFQLPANMVFGAALVLLLFLSLNHAIELSHLEDDRRRLVEEVALANMQLNLLQDRVAALEPPASGVEPTVSDAPPTPRES